MSRSLRRIAATLLVAALAGCNAPEIVAALDHSFRLGVGRQAVLPRERLEIGFARVMNDSRCPEGANCVWAGEAVVALWMGPEGGKPETFEVKLPATARADSGSVVDRGGYRLHLLGLEPKPKAGQAIDTTAYVLELRVSRL